MIQEFMISIYIMMIAAFVVWIAFSMWGGVGAWAVALGLVLMILTLKAAV